jgi:putative ABC transport system ATP-binding protein
MTTTTQAGQGAKEGLTSGGPQTETQKSLLKLEGLTKVFSTDEVETHALSNLHLDIKKGEWTAIVGPSGSGKTTLLAILGLLDTPSSGTFLLDGEAVSGLSATQRAYVRNRHIGFIFQSFNLIGDLSVHENVELPLTYRGMPAPERKQRVEAALERVGMSHRAKHLPSQLSGGQQQRVAVARAVAGDPLILLADEPTGNLDSKNGQAVMELLGELHRAGSTICMVTHDPAQARLATRTVHLFDGRIVESYQA